MKVFGNLENSISESFALSLRVFAFLGTFVIFVVQRLHYTIKQNEMGTFLLKIFRIWDIQAISGYIDNQKMLQERNILRKKKCNRKHKN